MSSDESNGKGTVTPKVRPQDSEESLPHSLPGAPSGPHDQLISLVHKLEFDVKQLVRCLQGEYPDRVKRCPKIFKKQVLELFQRYLPPWPNPSGRPRQARITKAAEMFVAQLKEIEEGRRKQVHWGTIAQACIPGYGTFRELRRRAELRKLRDAVYARRRCTKRKKYRTDHRS